jgi:uncharacterized membrane protein
MTLRLIRQTAPRAGRFFGFGVTIGVVVGLVVGSLLALRLGGVASGSIRALVNRVARRDDRVNFELLLQ